MSPVVHTSNTYSFQKKKNFFSFPVAVDNFIKVGPLVFLLYIFVITENITKHPVSSDMKKCSLPSELFSFCVLATGPGRLQTVEVQKDLGSVRSNYH
jgi:hypothetical protein